ncbi:Zinc finger, RING-H2-type [Dillenia turbinata]|uniref:RING-type E3 ubiquitin transferase n=1 Tax=Dillenia turbinata TaxID=194707 RepID=A0AAN8WJQ7_9MAGN
MGACCCCPSRMTAPNAAPSFYYCPRSSEERQPLSSSHYVAPVSSTGLLVDTNLETSTPDTYFPPPPPVPYNMGPLRPQTSPGAQEMSADKGTGTPPLATNTVSVDETVADNSVKGENFKESDSKDQGNPELDSSKEAEIELSKSGVAVLSVPEEEDVCPTCLEEYNEENPKIITKCEHHFHLACILEWLERSDTCAVCDKVYLVLNYFLLWKYNRVLASALIEGCQAMVFAMYKYCLLTGVHFSS